MINEIIRLVSKKAVLFRFNYNNNYYLYTDNSRPVVYGGETYLPAIINADEVYKSNGEAFKNNVNIELTISNDLVKVWTTPGTAPTRRISFEMTEVLVKDVSQKNIWTSGEVVGLTTDNEKATLSCVDQAYLYQKNSLRTTYSRTCPWNQYDAICGLNINDWAHATTITSIDPTRTIIGVSSMPIDTTKLQGGRVETDYSIYIAMSLDAGALQIETDTPLQTISNVGDIIKLVPTCSYLQQTCKNTFNNKVNFGGHTFITTSIFDPNQIDLP